VSDREVEIRGLREEEYPRLLAMLPRVMGAPRTYFVAHYRHDPHGKPEHSRVALIDGEIVAHLRLYERRQFVGGVPVPVGCVGDVCTLPEYRKQGLCRALLEDAVAYFRDHDFNLSQVVSGVGVYRRCGWAPFPEMMYRAPSVDHDRGGGRAAGPILIRRFARGEDLEAVAAVHARYHEGRSLATARPLPYWERHFYWLTGEREEAFLLAEVESTIVAYARGRSGGERLVMSECCYRPEHADAVRPLCEAFFTLAARSGCAHVEAVLPEDHAAIAFFADQPLWSAAEQFPLLFRLVDLARLLRRLEPLLSERLGRVVLPAGSIFLDLIVGEQAARLAVTADGVRVTSVGGDAAVPGAHPVRIDPAAFFLLLFGQAGSSEIPIPQIEAGPARAAVTAMFPRGAPIYWRTDIV
jgi:predicted N-acetyltransferase YhbS